MRVNADQTIVCWGVGAESAVVRPISVIRVRHEGEGNVEGWCRKARGADPRKGGLRGGYQQNVDGGTPYHRHDDTAEVTL